MNSKNQYYRTQSELLESLNQQIDLLHLSCNNFDNGNMNAALYMASTIRVLLHHTEKSFSILNQLKTCFNIDIPDFYDNGNNLYDPSAIVRSNLSNYKVEVISDSEVKMNVCPILSKSNNLVDFESWWHNISIYWETYTLSRKDIILLLANKEGGSHVDPKIPEELMLLKRNISPTVVFIINSIPLSIKSEEFIRNAVRTIAQEVLFTFDDYVFPVLKSHIR